MFTAFNPRILPFAVLAFSPLCGCAGDPVSAIPDGPDASVFLPDPAESVSSLAPVVSPETPALNPYSITPVRGTVLTEDGRPSTATHVIVEGIEPPVVASAVAGRFCVEVELEPGEHLLQLRARERDGRLTEATTFTLVRDEAAPRVPSLLGCDGTGFLEPCIPQPTETCGNGLDDDCDGVDDSRDPDCPGLCPDDALEQTGAMPPQLQPGTFFDLALCGDLGDSDSYRFRARNTDVISIAVQPQTAGVEMRAVLQGPSGSAELEIQDDVVQLQRPAMSFLPIDAEPGLYPFTLRIVEANDLDAVYDLALLVGTTIVNQ